MQPKDWIWIPNKSIGWFVFEKKLDITKLPFKLKQLYFDDDEEIYDRERLNYEIIEDTTRFRIIKKNLIFDRIECCTYCIYKNKNLIGMTLKELKKTLNEELEIEPLEYYGPFLDSDEEWTEQIVHCDKLDAMFFFKNDVVESVAL